MLPLLFPASLMDTCPSMIKTYVIKTDEYALVGGAPIKRPTFLHPTGLAYRYLLSCIPPVLHPSCLASLLSCIPPVLHPTCLASHLSCIPPALHPSCLTSLLSCIRIVLHPFPAFPHVLHPSCLGSLLSWIPPSGPAFLLSSIHRLPRFPASVLSCIHSV